MWKTFIIGNLLFAACLYGYWHFVGIEKARIVPSLLCALGIFVSGIITGIVANTPKQLKVKPQSSLTASTRVAAQFDLIE